MFETEINLITNGVQLMWVMLWVRKEASSQRDIWEQKGSKPSLILTDHSDGLKDQTSSHITLPILIF